MTTTRLRAARPEEAELLSRWHDETTSPFEDWSGDLPPGVERAQPVGRSPGCGELVVTDRADRPIGTVSWRPVLYGPRPGSLAHDIGISLRPEARGRGHGSRGQRLLADYLFATTPVHRVQASTDVENTAEQRALERAGFTAEGVLRAAQWRLGEYHDLVLYSRLRTDA